MSNDDYEAAAIVVGEDSDNFNFVVNCSSTAEGAKSGLRSRARVLFVDDYRKNEELALENLEVHRLDPDTGKRIEQVNLLNPRLSK